METTPPVMPHLLVLKRAQEWVAFAAKYGVEAVIETPTDGAYPGSLVVNFDTRSWYERGSVVIYPPRKPGRTVRQSPLIMRHYFGQGGKRCYGQKPGTTLRDLYIHVSDYWSPTWTARLKAEADRARAREVAA